MSPDFYIGFSMSKQKQRRPQQCRDYVTYSVSCYNYFCDWNFRHGYGSENRRDLVFLSPDAVEQWLYEKQLAA